MEISSIPPPATGISQDIAPGVRWLRMPLPLALNHVNTWLIKDDDERWTAVDTGLCTDDIRAAWQAILPTHPLARLLITHFHPDHMGLASWLQEKTHAPVYMSQGEYTTAQLIYHQIDGYSIAAMIAFFCRHGLEKARADALEVRGNVFRRAISGVPAEFFRLIDGETLRIGAQNYQLIAGYGHSAEHISLYCADSGVLISGDMLLPRISTNISSFAAAPNVNALAYFLNSIRRFEALPDDTLVLPSHGLPFRGIKTRVAQLVAHHQERCAILLKACSQRPRSACELIPDLFERDFSDAHQTMFAMGECIAHLVYLEHAGLLRREVTQETTQNSKIIRFTV